MVVPIEVLWTPEKEAVQAAEVNAAQEAEAERLRAGEAEIAERERRLSGVKEKLGLTDQDLGALRAALAGDAAKKGRPKSP